MKLTNLNKNSLETIMKKMNTMTLQQTAKTSKLMNMYSKSEINKRKRATKIIKKMYIDSKRNKIKQILKNGMNVMDEYMALQLFPNNINDDLINEFLVQYPITHRQEILILKELIQYLLINSFEPHRIKKRTMNMQVNYIMKTSFQKGEGDMHEMLNTNKRFFM